MNLIIYFPEAWKAQLHLGFRGALPLPPSARGLSTEVRADKTGKKVTRWVRPKGSEPTPAVRSHLTPAAHRDLFDQGAAPKADEAILQDWAKDHATLSQRWDTGLPMHAPRLHSWTGKDGVDVEEIRASLPQGFQGPAHAVAPWLRARAADVRIQKKRALANMEEMAAAGEPADSRRMSRRREQAEGAEPEIQRLEAAARAAETDGAGHVNVADHTRVTADHFDPARSHAGREWAAAKDRPSKHPRKDGSAQQEERVIGGGPSVAQYQAAGLSLWEGAGGRRLYVGEDLAGDAAGLVRNGRGGTFNGAPVSNAEAARVASTLRDAGLHLDLEDGAWTLRGNKLAEGPAVRINGQEVTWEQITTRLAAQAADK